MEKLQYSISINAGKEKVWQTLWEASSYEKWTLPFCEGSRVETDWLEGSKILFLSAAGSGMIGVIEKNKPNEYMAFRHIGMVKNGIADTESDAVKSWAGAMETYTLSGGNSHTDLLIEMDTQESHKSYFQETWPKALEQLKQLAEYDYPLQKITPFLWYDGTVEEAVNLYTSVFRHSKVKSRNAMSATIEINGQELILFNGGPMFKFTPAFSMFINCETQEEVDELWEKLGEGGTPNRCGWLQDKFGLSWQIVPSILGKYIQDKNPVKSKNVVNAMLQMTKLDIKKIQEAYDQE